MLPSTGSDKQSCAPCLMANCTTSACLLKIGVMSHQQLNDAKRQNQKDITCLDILRVVLLKGCRVKCMVKDSHKWGEGSVSG